MPYFVYILYSSSTDHYYIGSSSDPQARLIRHNAGATTSTKSGRPWEIIYTEKYETKSEALIREVHLKKMKSRKYLENLFRK